MEIRELPRYSIPEAAGYVRMKPRTLASWVRSRDGQEPLIRRPVPGDPRLSFENLLEAYVLCALRRTVGISMQKIRLGLAYAEEELDIERLLLSEQLRVRKGQLIVETFGRYLNLGAGGQFEIREAVEEYLRRIDFENGLPARLYPVTRARPPLGPTRIVIVPEIGFGKPVTHHHHISTAVIADRFRAGESVSELAHDYDLDDLDVEEALRAETPLAA